MAMQIWISAASRPVDPSVGTAGDCHEFKLVRTSGLNDLGDHSKAPNALAESVIAPFKAKVIKQLGHWQTMHDVEWGTMHWVDCCIQDRLLS
ncbi:hypothetical protein [Leisingera methylohalidivorans]|uniref:hypothetical protein n=1 Tax=Leisingera methylohalidivorans TaxID=133924 RepID=UPI000413159E|nr:hypothetical protein [Leisingera methylohalidivorans]